MTHPVRTRFAPSPTGYLHLGGARTALFSWAYARRNSGSFVLRIEDTDLERSTQASIQAILDGMSWLGLNWDEGPFFQMRRLDRYREIADQLLHDGHAYWCYASKEELDAMREAQRARGEKPRYDGRWRPENAEGRSPPPGVKPVLRFRNPLEGNVAWNDLVKGGIEFDNRELDDLVLLRADGVPTYNFGVVVDDLDMRITHVIRGDDHVNNTPRQINIYRALGASIPEFAHVPMILGPDGERLSKRHGAVSVMQYDADGYLSEAMINYLARLGWSHGNEEIFSTQQFIEWFDLQHISRSAAQFNPEKLKWMNQQYVKTCPFNQLLESVRKRVSATGKDVERGPSLEKLVALYRDRAATLNELGDALEPYWIEIQPAQELLAQHLTEHSKPALAALKERLRALPQDDWQAGVLSQALKEIITSHRLKMPQLAIPLRVVLTGQTQTPSIDALLEAMGKDLVLDRLLRHV